jgi:hypothetical protein
MSEVKFYSENSHKSRLKLAIVIADSSGKPFEEIKASLHPAIWERLALLGVDIFYVKGTEPNRMQQSLNNFSEVSRYSKFWPVQNLLDRLLLFKFNSRIPSCRVNQHFIKVEICEGLRTLGVKMLSAYKYLYQENYDCIFKTTLSSLVNEDAFMAFIHNLPRDRIVYGGTPVNFGNHPFASGSNTLLNRAALEFIFDNLNHWNHGFLDDVAMGRIFEGIAEITPIASIHIDSIAQANSIPGEKLKQTVHFRCKSRSIPRNDVEIIQRLRERLRAVVDGSFSTDEKHI